ESITSQGDAPMYQFISNHPQLVTVSEKGRVLQFNNKTEISVQTNYPLLIRTDSVENEDASGGNNTMFASETTHLPSMHYFEITVLSNTNSEASAIAIGLATKHYPPFSLPGWYLHSVGYHSDDGQKFYDAVKGSSYGPTWGEVGDTIGCGYYPDRGCVFFTKNGENLGDAFTGIRHIWFPTIGVVGSCKLQVNFGDGERPFRYLEARWFGPARPIQSDNE
ncbi:4282_t:CDS:2, partial [Paraglomus occultum]